MSATSVALSIAALKKDLLNADGPAITTMRNYRFAIVQYAPEDEYSMRREVSGLSRELEVGGWRVLSIDLQKLILDRLRVQEDDFVARVIERERGLHKKHPERAMQHLKNVITPLIEGPDGIAADCARLIQEMSGRYPDDIDRTLALIGRTGALYPFLRTSSLLRHLDGHTGNVPVVLLYPGERRGPSGLSFMGMLEPDHDYRPRIYS